MPSIDRTYLAQANDDSSRQLFRAGALIEVRIERLHSQAVEYRPSSPFVEGLGLIDPGARHCGVDLTVIEKLNLPVNGSGSMVGLGGAKHTNWHDGVIFVPSIDLPFLGKRLIGLDLHAGEAYVPPDLRGEIVALLGRDILQHCSLMYDGPAGRFTLSRG
jgi:hypothetical protein